MNTRIQTSLDRPLEPHHLRARAFLRESRGVVGCLMATLAAFVLFGYFVSLRSENQIATTGPALVALLGLYIIGRGIVWMGED